MAKTIAITLAALLLASAGYADTLLIDGVDMDRQTSDLRPRAGMTMAAVESTYGTPSERRAPVGGPGVQQPPITRWDYPTFSVYFEHDRVVHAVARRQ